MMTEPLIAIWMEHAHDPMDAAIKFLTRGEGTHAAFVRRNRRIVENFFPHVRERDWRRGELATVELFRLERLTTREGDLLEAWFDAQLRRPPAYSIRDLFRYAMDMPPVPGRSCFCSQWVLRGIRLNVSEGKQPLVRLKYKDFAPPSQLRSSPRLIRTSILGAATI